jgi:uncharacterized protein YbbC (DUF1343 family)/CubicO group peptidase (beta-lactamase class C family)
MNEQPCSRLRRALYFVLGEKICYNSLRFLGGMGFVMNADRGYKRITGRPFFIPAIYGILLVALCLLIEPLLWKGVLARVLPDSPLELREEQLEPIAEVVEKAIQEGQIPGAVVLVGNQEQVLYRKAFGYRSLVPDKQIMTEDTIFDVASLTKVVATTTAVMQQVEKGKLSLEDPVAKHWSAFKANGKRYITVRHLLTHTSGLRPDLSLKHRWYGNGTALKKIIAEKPVAPPGKRVIYSDINFAVLGELVRRVSGQSLDIYCSEHIFKPLGMRDTVFTPPTALRDRIAPTEYLHESSGKILWGEVHDPTAYRMGGVAGHAGLFSTADDLSLFARMLLEGGGYKGVRILKRRTVEKMTTPQTLRHKTSLRGLGWEINSPAPHKRSLFPLGTYGHTGYTGTSLWIDPDSGTYVIILTNRVHPDGKGDACPLRTDISMVVEGALGKDSIEQALAAKGLRKSERLPGRQNGKVQTGIDVLKAEQFASLSGLRIGLITNHTGLDSTGQRTLDLFYQAQGMKLAAVFSPEHGLSGKVDEKIASITETTTGLPVYSLYGDVLRPTDKMLDGLDALVFDVQDAGVRFYTYITTMGYAMEAAARKGLSFYVLDRPNPLTGSLVHGPVMDQDLKSFVGYFPLPTRHGMTVGELAKMFNEENRIGVALHVIRMRGYERNFWYDETGLQWVNPSPNLRSLTQAILYPGVAMVEGSNVSVGRGTETPFEIFGAPWIDAGELAGYLNKRKILGVSFSPEHFTPASSVYKNKLCHGVRIILLDRQAFDPALLGIEITAALHRLYKKEFQIDKTLGLIGSRRVLQEIKEGQDPLAIVMHWQESLEDFQRLRANYLLY